VFPFYVERKRSTHQEEYVKSKTTTIALFGLLAVALAVGLAFAQAEGDQTHHRGMGMHGGFMGGHEMGFPLHALNLTDDQKTQVKQIMQTEKPNIKPLMQQEFQAHQQMMQLVTSGKFDQTQATALATQEAQTHIQMQVEHAKIAAQIYQLLSSDQKAKVADMMAKHQQRMQEHMQNQQQPAPPADNQ
jgi:Spy/CpxP family protein refolding chaperone